MQSSDVPHLSVRAAHLPGDLRTAITSARRLGFDGVVLDVSSDLLTLSGTGRRELRSVLARHDQPLVALRHDLDGRGLCDPHAVDRHLADAERAGRLARDLDCRLVLCDLGRLPAAAAAPTPRPTTPGGLTAGLLILPTPQEVARLTADAAVPPEPPADPGEVAVVDSALTEWGRRADRLGVTFAFAASLASSASLLRALNAADCPQFAIDLDPAAVVADPWTLSRTFDEFGTRLAHVRGRDANRGQGARTVTTALGTGDTDIAELLTLLHDADYAGWVTVEGDAWRDTLACLKRQVS